MRTATLVSFLVLVGCSSTTTSSGSGSASGDAGATDGSASATGNGDAGGLSRDAAQSDAAQDAAACQAATCITLPDPGGRCGANENLGSCEILDGASPCPPDPACVRAANQSGGSAVYFCCPD